MSVCLHTLFRSSRRYVTAGRVQDESEAARQSRLPYTAPPLIAERILINWTIDAPPRSPVMRVKQDFAGVSDSGIHTEPIPTATQFLDLDSFLWCVGVRLRYAVVKS